MILTIVQLQENLHSIVLSAIIAYIISAKVVFLWIHPGKIMRTVWLLAVFCKLNTYLYFSLGLSCNFKMTIKQPPKLINSICWQNIFSKNVMQIHFTWFFQHFLFFKVHKVWRKTLKLFQRLSKSLELIWIKA